MYMDARNLIACGLELNCVVMDLSRGFVGIAQFFDFMPSQDEKKDCSTVTDVTLSGNCLLGTRNLFYAHKEKTTYMLIMMVLKNFFAYLYI